MNLKYIKLVGTDWIHLAQDRDQWRALVNKVMNVVVPANAGNFISTPVSVNF
jgi:hypothetical protein